MRFKCLAKVPQPGLDAEASVSNMRPPRLHFPEKTLSSLSSLCTDSLGSFFSICRHCILLLHWYRFRIRLLDWWVPFGHHWRVVDVPSEWRSNIDRTRSMCSFFCDNKTA